MNSLFHNTVSQKAKTFHTPARPTDNTCKVSQTDWNGFHGLMDRVIELTSFLLFVEAPFFLAEHCNIKPHLILLFDGKEQKQTEI